MDQIPRKPGISYNPQACRMMKLLAKGRIQNYSSICNLHNTITLISFLLLIEILENLHVNYFAPIYIGGKLRPKRGAP